MLETQLSEFHQRADFGRLQQRLARIWKSVQARPDYEHTSVVVPSLSFDQEVLSKVAGASYYEERLLFSLIRLRHPNARVMYVTSLPIHPEIIDYYLQLLVGVPSSHARRRLALFCVHDASQRALTEKILERPRVIRRIRDWVGDPSRGYLTCFNSSELERSLAMELGIPLNGCDPSLLHWGTKSGSRKLFRRAGAMLLEGSEDLRDEGDVVDALERLIALRPNLRRAVVKLNAGFSGEGNALYTVPEDLPSGLQDRRRVLCDRLHDMEWTAPDDSYEHFIGKFLEMGGVVEEFLEADEVHSPSVQMRINPDGGVELVSTHEQVLGGATGQVYLGCRFPARDAFRDLLHDQALRIGEALAREGVVSRFSIDFLVFRQAGGPWQSATIEVNLRMGGTTHPFLALEFLTGGGLEPHSGLFRSHRGEHKYHFSTDNLKSPRYRGLLPDDLMDILVHHGLHFRHAAETGVLFHMIGALSEFGKVGVTCIGNTPSEAEDLYSRTVAMLDLETGATGELGGHAQNLLDRRMPRME